VLIVPLLAAAGRLRMAAGTPTSSPIKASVDAGNLFGVSCRYVGDASRLRDLDPASFARLLDGSITMEQAIRLLK
jgi:hypothetical protein